MRPEWRNGRRRGLKILRRKACEFDSRLGHQYSVMITLGVILRRIDLQRMSKAKLEAAEVLARAGKHSNAYYLAGYSVEFALKACIARLISADTLPEKGLIVETHSHDFGKLMGLAGLRAELTAAERTSPSFAANWGICCEWSPNDRYNERSAFETNDLLRSINDSRDGVLTWISRYW